MNKKDIYYIIHNYSWMMKLLISKRNEMLNGSKGLVSKYGIESTLPGPKNINSDPVYQEILRIERQNKNTKKIRDKISLIQRHSKVITDIRDQIILDNLLDGLTLRDIAVELDMSLAAVKRRKDAIVNQIYDSVQKEQAEQMEQKEKICG